MIPHIPEGLFPVSMVKATTTNGSALATDFVNVGKAQMAYIVVHLTQTVGHATVVAVERATAAASGNVVIANTVPIWYGNVTTSTNALTRQTDAISYTMGGSVTGDVIIVFEIDPANLGTTYKYVGVTFTDSSQATNFAEVMCYLVPRYGAQAADAIDYLT